MSEKNIKLLRGQVRNVVKESLTEEAFKAIEARLTKTLNEKLSEVTRTVKEGLEVIDQRSKDLQAYVVRNVAVPTAPVVDAPAADAPSPKADDASLG